MDTSSRRQTVEFPRPEAGLAEWTNRIKELQREVDADEEVEQRRLEEEIRASRIARKRRSTGPSSSGISVGRSRSPPDTERRHSPDSQTVQDRARGQTEALRKLTGSTTPSNMAASGVGKPEPISLAAFMGGKATGPRLNRHAPQQDAHDPTQFEQRRDISNPHPIFGSGGVAMPGMVSKPSSSKTLPTSTRLGADRSVSVQSDRSWIRERTTSTPASAVSSVRPVETPVSEEPRGNLATYRRQSTSKVAEPSLIAEPFPRVPLAQSKPEGLRRQPSQEPASASTASRSSAPIISPSPRGVAPASNIAKASTVVSPPPSLARPITPHVRPTSTGPQIPVSISPSPAFLKPPQQKDLTPSLSRLQGRGFVQSMTKLSDELEAASGTASSSEKTPKKNSVLDRWPAAQQASPQPSPSPSPLRAMPMRRANTTESPTTASQPNNPLQNSQRGTPKHANSFPEASQRKSIEPPKDKPLEILGSSNTLISFVKPTKTGDDPLTDQRPPSRPASAAGRRSVHEADELGVRKKLSSGNVGQRKAKSEVSAVPASRPLSHPTKDRARRPRKGDSAAYHEAIPLDSPDEEPVELLPELPTAPPSSSPPIQHSPVQGSNIRRLQESWANQAPIGVKQVRKPAPFAQNDGGATVPAKPIRHALPGMAPSRAASMPEPAPASPPSPPLTPPLTVNKEPVPPPNPSRLTRRGSGSRPTVMDVAQALNDKSREATRPPVDRPKQAIQASAPTASPIPQASSTVAQKKPTESNSGGWERTVTPALFQAERRKANAEKYSSFVMPVLTEVKTPESSPANTLTKADAAEPTNRGSNLNPGAQPTSAGPTPTVNVAKLLQSSVHSALPSDSKTVSVEILSIAGSNASTVTGNIIYDSENLVIVHRRKSLQSGLATTKVWNWRGKESRCGDVEERKIRELATRFGATAVLCLQHCEPLDLVQAIGGTLIIRVGTRTLWSSDNTTMHIVRAWKGCIIIDEVDLGVQRLCSGYSACISVLDNVWVWHGCGSTDDQREQALKYAKGLTAGTSKMLVEVEEGKEDDSFWMFLGQDTYAHADYWRFRKQATDDYVDPRIWRVDCSAKAEPVKELLGYATTNDDTSVHVIDLVYEAFVLIGDRSDKRDGILALNVAKEISNTVSKARPFPPPVHVLVLPSRIPLDLLSSVRGLESTLLLGGEMPEYMNIMTQDDALNHLRSG